MDAAEACIANPTTQDISTASSLHAYAFDAGEAMILAQSEGDFTLGIWEESSRLAQRACCRRQDLASDEHAMTDQTQESESIEEKLRTAVQLKVATNQGWKHAVDTQEARSNQGLTMDG